MPPLTVLAPRPDATGPASGGPSYAPGMVRGKPRGKTMPAIDMIGADVLASGMGFEIEGRIVGGRDDDGIWSTAHGIRIDLDDVVAIRCGDTGEVLKVNGWLASFDLA